MRKLCDGCIWQEDCSGRVRCGYYTPMDESEEVVTREQLLDRKNFNEDWAEYMVRDDDVDWCEEPVNDYGQELIKTKRRD